MPETENVQSGHIEGKNYSLWLEIPSECHLRWVIIVSHDLEQVINNKGRVIFMNEGNITYDLKESGISKEKLLALYTKTLEKVKL